jgi:hypothetical protein
MAWVKIAPGIISQISSNGVSSKCAVCMVFKGEFQV